VVSTLTPTVLYIRQSLTRDKSESIPLQIERCTEAAQHLGAEIVETLVEPPSTSGFKDRGRGRPRFLDLLELVRSGRARAVMAYKSDRLSRGGGPGWAPLIEAFEEAGCDTDHAVLTPNGWLSEFEIGIRASMDREESKKLSDRMRDVRAREAREGKPRISGRPYGYSCSGLHPETCEVVGCRHDGTMSLVPPEHEVILEVVERVLLGESLWRIANDLNARGVPSARGGEWRTSQLTRLLTNPRYVGMREHNGIVVAEGTWERAIDRSTWDRLQETLKSRPTAGRRRFGARTYPLVGFLFCSKCDGKLRSIRKQNGKRAYYCRKGAGLGGCGGISTIAEPVEAEVRHYVVGKLCDPAYRKQLVRLAETAADESESLADQLADAEVQRDMLLDLYLEKKVTKVAYERRYAALTESIGALGRKAFTAPEQSVLRDLPLTVEQLDELWDGKGIGFQRQLIDLVIQRVEVLPGQQGRKTFDPSRLVWHPR
jgi:DNA invertase Pin-like site-specific DNA recombinase